MMMNSTGLERADWPSDGGLVGKARTPGSDENCGCSCWVMACCLRLRSSQGFRRRMAVPSVTVGKPTVTWLPLASGISE
ncbi:hypothetical protein D3C72_2339850 [compost metagenome]